MLDMDAVRGVYEPGRIDLLRDLFTWAHGWSATRYAAVRQSLDEPDPVRPAHRSAIHLVVGDVIRQQMDKRIACKHNRRMGCRAS